MDAFYNFNESRPWKIGREAQQLADRAVEQWYDAHRQGRLDPTGADIRWEDRFAPDAENAEREQTLLRNGVKVRTEVDLSYKGHAGQPLLFIDVHPLPHTEQPRDHFTHRFTRFTSDRPMATNLNWHVSIANMQEISDSVPDWQNKLRYLYSKFHDNV